MSGERANYSCLSCDSSDVFQERGNIYECENCGLEIHEAVAENADLLADLSERDDKAGEFAGKLLETGGISQ